MQKVAIGVNNIRLAKFVLNQSHDIRQIRLAHVLSVRYSRHGFVVKMEGGRESEVVCVEVEGLSKKASDRSRRVRSRSNTRQS